jgi:hypothetical protein
LDEIRIGKAKEVNNETNSKNKQRLNEDLVKYCKQIGITGVPRLILDRKEMHAILVNAGKRKRCAGWGQCFRSMQTIFVDTGIRIHYPSRRYKGVKLPTRELVKHKSKYTDFRNTLVHELVHYRFAYLRHGKRFEKRINEILRGRIFDTSNSKKAEKEALMN